MSSLGEKALIISFSFFLAVFFYQNAFAFDDGDFQYWNNESIAFKITEDWKASFEEEFRLGDNGGNLYYQHSDWGVTYSGIAEWLDLGVFYRNISEKKNSKWRREDRPHLDAAVKWELFDCAMSNRGRFEYRDREDAEDLWQYRNKFTVKLPFKLTKVQIQPYIADEIFIDFDQERLNRNRLYTGFSMKFTKSLKGEIFYLWQSSKKSGKWSDLNVLGTKLKLSF
ncbi:MAG: DUF2490 domain-containing protein [Candidatus Omnitrophota bacterium]|nr:MAG: DUF2490 domain-containing protein [Candidatus Omnitrophota bacterium]